MALVIQATVIAILGTIPITPTACLPLPLRPHTHTHAHALVVAVAIASGAYLRLGAVVLLLLLQPLDLADDIQATELLQMNVPLQCHLSLNVALQLNQRVLVRGVHYSNDELGQEVAPNEDETDEVYGGEWTHCFHAPLHDIHPACH